MAKRNAPVDLPPIILEAFGNSPEEQEDRLNEVMDWQGYPAMCMMLVDLILRRADIAVFDFTQQNVAIKYQIDGLWHPMPPMDREEGDAMLESLKQIGGANIEERRARQEARFRGTYNNKKFSFRVISQGVATGERVALYVDFKRPPMETLADLGIRDGMRDQLLPILNGDQQLVVTTALPGEGYTSLWRATLAAADRFTRDFYVIEDVAHQENEVINVGQVFYDRSKGENAFTPIRQLLLKEPNVIAFTEIPDGATLTRICDLITTSEVQSMSRIHGKNAVEALARMMAMKPDLEKFARCLKVILAMRVVRKLCEKCRVEFTPSAQMLSALGIPAGRVRRLYRAKTYQPGEVDERGQEIPPCKRCLGTGFLGRTGLFELLRVDEKLQRAITANLPPKALADVVANSGHISIREEAVLLVAKGITSIEEVQRVLSK